MLGPLVSSRDRVRWRWLLVIRCSVCRARRACKGRVGDRSGRRGRLCARRRGTLDLGAVHDPARCRDRTDRAGAWCSGCPTAPGRRPASVLYQVNSSRVGVGPDLIEQRFGLREREPLDVGVATAAEIQPAPPAVGMRADQRMERSGRGSADRRSASRPGARSRRCCRCRRASRAARRRAARSAAGSVS